MWAGFKQHMRLYYDTYILVFILFLVLFVFRLGISSGASMEPTIDENGELLIIDHSGIGENEGIDFYDIVALRDIEVDGEVYNFGKRAIGLPGDHIEIKNGVVFRNGEEIDDSIIQYKDTYTNLTTTVSEGHIFVLGDNRANSMDSRYFGEVPIENVVGVVRWIFDLDWLERLLY